jgi:putative flippase GtrA
MTSDEMPVFAPKGIPIRLVAIYQTFRHVIHEIAKFGVVGAFNFIIDVGLFNILRVSVLSSRPVTASVISTGTAATTSYFMNRHWTWRHRARTGVHRELPLFLVLSAVGLGISTGCLAFSHYVIGLHSLLADNLAKNGVGLLLGMVWRFWSFKRWVFLAPEGEAEEAGPVEAAVRTSV